jgi:hypothetical protein
VKSTAYFREIVRVKHPGIAADWILRSLREPVEHRLHAVGRHLFWELVPEAGGKVHRLMTLEDRETVHNACFDRGYLRRLKALPTTPA